MYTKSTILSVNDSDLGCLLRHPIPSSIHIVCYIFYKI